MTNKKTGTDPAVGDYTAKMADRFTQLLAYVDNKLVYRYTNKAYQDMFSPDGISMVGKNKAQVLGDVNYELVKPYIESVLAGEKVEFNRFIEGNNGNRRHLKVEFSPDSESGDVKGFYVMMVDVSQDIENQYVMSREKAFLDSVLENAATLVVMLDCKGRVQRFNRACEKATGFVADQIIGKQVWECLIPEEVIPNVQKVFDNLLAGDVSSHYVNEWKTSEGGRVLVDWHNTALLDEEGNVQSVLSIGLDITEKQRVADALKRSEETYSRAEEIAHIGSWDWDILSGDLRWTDEIYRIFGQEPQAFGATYEAFLDTIHPDDQKAVVDAVGAAVADPNVEYSIEHRVVQKSGDIRVVHERGKVYRNDSGEPVRMIGTVHDITDRKQAEEELRLYREQLERLVEERTRELKEAQGELVKSERLATLGQLTATVSHELRNPLGAMRPSLFVLKKKSSSEDRKVAQAIERIDRNIKRCDRIIDELLDFTRIRELDREKLQFDNWLGGLLQDIVNPDGVPVEFHGGADAVEVDFDPDRMRRVLINLVDNACQAAEEKKTNTTTEYEPKVYIRTKYGKDRIFIEVEDNGTGISEENLPRILEPLFSTKGFGVGLGLPAVKQIIVQHGGDLEIASTSGEGTIMKMWIPLNAEKSDSKTRALNDEVESA